MKQRPNFLFIMTDQLRPDHTGFGGNPVVQTPNLDRLAAQSRQFDRAYCPIPLCGPARASIMTGRMPSVHGSWYNSIALDWDANTFVRVLRQAGYRTGLIGKSHLQDFVVRGMHRPNQSVDFPVALPPRYPPSGTDRAVKRGRAADWDQWEHPLAHEAAMLMLPEDYYGFDHVELLLRHDDHGSGHYSHWLRDRGVDPATLGGPDNARQTSPHWLQIYESNTPAELYPSAYVGERAMAFLDTAQQDDAPFFLVASFPDPHHPFAVPEPYYSMYDPADIPLPATFDDPHTNTMPHYRDRLSRRGENYQGPFLFSCSEAQYRHAAAVEYGSITLLDEQVGRILTKLEETGQRENTVIIFCSDHGDMFGDHGLMLKLSTHYDGAVRVPLLIHTPDMAPGATDHLAGLIDIGPTVLELAGCESYVGMQGHSLCPLLTDPTAAVRDSVLIEEDLLNDLTGYGCNSSMRTLITPTARLTLYRGTPLGELYDLQNDPLEMDNLYGSPAGRSHQAELTEQLLRTMWDHRELAFHPL